MDGGWMDDGQADRWMEDGWMLEERMSDCMVGG